MAPGRGCTPHLVATNASSQTTSTLYHATQLDSVISAPYSVKHERKKCQRCRWLYFERNGAVVEESNRRLDWSHANGTIRGYWPNLTEREISGIKIITQGQTQLAQVERAITQTIVAKKSEEVRDDLREAGNRARDRHGGYAEAPSFRLHGNSDDDQEDRISESESNCSEQWYELDGQEQEALISLRDARKKLQHATKSRRFYPKGGGRARSTGKSIDELKKVTPCNRCGAIGHWEEDCTQPARSRKKRSAPPQEEKEKVVGSGEENLMEKDEELQTILSHVTYEGSSWACGFG